AGRLHPLAAAHRRQSGIAGETEQRLIVTKSATNSGDLKVLNRADLTKRLVAKLKHDEAVIGGIGNANFDLFAAGHRPQNFYMLGSMGLTCSIALGVAVA